MAAASSTVEEHVLQYELLDLSTLQEGLEEPSESLKAMAAASGGLVHDVRQIVAYAHAFVCPHPGASILWLQVSSGAPILARRVFASSSQVTGLSNTLVAMKLHA